MNPSVRIQKNIAFLAIILFLLKLLAWRWTHSVAVFTDALESIVNVVTGLIGWYSVWLAAKPRDQNHPYGHGKVEYISAAIEGTLITIAGLTIIYEAFQHLKHPVGVQKIDIGVAILAATAIINFWAGSLAVSNGIKRNSAAMEAAGKHLRTDTYSTIGVIAGLIIIKFTGWLWLDLCIAFIIAAIILYTGYKVLRKSLAGIMDEADLKLLQEVISFLNQNRRPQWIDLHNLRMIQYGSILHLDGHLTLPWYDTVREAHIEIDALDKLIKQKFGNAIELFVHVDGCESFSCRICTLSTCPVRQHPHEKTISWTVANVLQNNRHTIESNDT
jgi:cation diffusion facilitator family transporter